MKRVIGLLLLWLLPVLLARADGDGGVTLRGVVTDSEGSPLPGASVWVEGSTLGVSTDARGEFLLTLEKPERQMLRVSFTGYKPLEYVWDGTPRAPLRFRLEKAELALEEVVVTGTRTPRLLKEAPILTRVLSREEIERVNPLDFQDLLESVLPGLQFGMAHGSNLPALSFQGVAGGYVLFLVDGERLAGEGAGGNVDFSRIDLDDIARVEVVKGPMSTLYGSQAMGGVVNIITRDAESPLRVALSTRWGTRDEMKHAASLGIKAGAFSSYTSLAYRSRHAYTVRDRRGAVTETHTPDTVIRDTLLPSRLSVPGYEILQGAQRFGYDFGGGWKAKLSASGYANRLRDPYAHATVQKVFSTYTLHPQIDYASDRHRLTASYLFDDYGKRERYTDGAPSRKIFRDLVQTARLNYTLFAGRHTLTAGAEADAQRMEHYWFNNGNDTSFSQRNYVVYLQEEWKATDRLDLIAGVRSDVHSAYGFHASPKVSAMLRLGDFALRGSYGMGFRIPTLKELHAEYDMGGLGAFMIYGNPDLKPETSHQGTLSLEYARGAFNASASAYHTVMRHAIGLTLAPDGKNQIYYNAPRGRKSGVDLLLQVRPADGLSLRAAYAYVNSHDRVDGYNLSAFRPHSLTYAIAYVRPVGATVLSASFDGRWLSAADVWNKKSEEVYQMHRNAPFSSLDLNLAARFPRGFRLVLGIDNLLDARSPNVSADPSLIPQRGIGFTGTLSYHFTKH